ncbi:hypothetical protein POTOM_061861 [Populus tomentosa]|uniref:Uncharacterized protein n=1 Tax=Populus tomentosa TaxID=118781 RepID=A0A8X7XP42_POPTO|nr:hypothetical protein POTOM_061861 [Populus tomentosa]
MITALGGGVKRLLKGEGEKDRWGCLARNRVISMNHVRNRNLILWSHENIEALKTDAMISAEMRRKTVKRKGEGGDGGGEERGLEERKLENIAFNLSSKTV